MRKNINIEELKIIQLNLLDALKEFCDRNSLTYYLAYGTLIGAVRHKGYIPWDDDVDILMPRRDYEKLIAAFNEGTDNQCLRLISHEINPEYYLPFAKLVDTSTAMQEEVRSDYQIGVYIDIFPLDNLDDDYEKAKKCMRKAFRYNALLVLKNLVINKDRPWYKNTIIRIGRIVSSKWSREYLIKRLNGFSLKKENDSYTDYVGLVTGITKPSEAVVLKGDWFKNTVDLEFEGKIYSAPAGYDTILTHWYGDYMQLPPPEQRISHHVFEAWYKE